MHIRCMSVYVLSMSNILSMFAALCVEGPPFPYIYIHTHELSLTRIISLSSSLSLALRFGAWGRAIEWGSKESVVVRRPVVLDVLHMLATRSKMQRPEKVLWA